MLHSTLAVATYSGSQLHNYHFDYKTKEITTLPFEVLTLVAMSRLRLSGAIMVHVLLCTYKDDTSLKATPGVDGVYHRTHLNVTNQEQLYKGPHSNSDWKDD